MLLKVWRRHNYNPRDVPVRWQQLVGWGWTQLQGDKERFSYSRHTMVPEQINFHYKFTTLVFRPSLPFCLSNLILFSSFLRPRRFFPLILWHWSQSIFVYFDQKCKKMPKRKSTCESRIRLDQEVYLIEVNFDYEITSHFFIKRHRVQ